MGLLSFRLRYHLSRLSGNVSQGMFASFCKVEVSKVVKWTGYTWSLWEWATEHNRTSNWLSMTLSSTFLTQPTHLSTGSTSIPEWRQQVPTRLHGTKTQKPQSKNIRDLCTGIKKFRKGYWPTEHFIKNKNSDVLADCKSNADRR